VFLITLFNHSEGRVDQTIEKAFRLIVVKYFKIKLFRLFVCMVLFLDELSDSTIILKEGVSILLTDSEIFL
jgi:hypothetical protein